MGVAGSSPVSSTKRYTAPLKCGFSLVFYCSGGSKKAYMKNADFYQSSNIQDFQVFAPFKPTEAFFILSTFGDTVHAGGIILVQPV